MLEYRHITITIMPESFSNLSKSVKERVILIIGFFLEEWEFDRAAFGEEKMQKLPVLKLAPQGKYKDSAGDIWPTVKILIKELRLENEFRPFIYGFERISSETSWKSLIQKLEVLKTRLEKEVRTDKSYKDNLIHSLAIVEPKGALHYLIIVNEDFENPIEVDAQSDTWKLLLRVAEGEQIEYKPEHKSAKDFLNTNISSRLYTKSGKDLTKILRVDQGKIVSLIDLKIISEKAYKQKINKLKAT